MPRRHGDTIYILPGSGAVHPLTSELLSPAGDAATAADPALATPRGEINGGLILAGAPATVFQVAALQALADVMLDKFEVRDPAQPLAPLEDVQLDNPSVPAGYTYLGQFINHDLTFNPTWNKPEDNYSAAEVEQAQCPSFDLSCVYGGVGLHRPSYKRLYQTTFPRMRVGMTEGMVDAKPPSENDLPREGIFAKNNPLAAVIADERNDDNLPLAQTHVAFLRFHNRVVSLLKEKNPGLSDDQLFEDARREVILCYQRIVLFDFLPKIVEPAAYQDVLTKPLRSFKVDDPAKFDPAKLFMPMEFAAAAFRMGHSMVRNTYSWNRIFQAHNPRVPTADVAPLSRLFQFTGNGGMRPFSKSLPTRWIIDWRRFYDFSGLVAGPMPPLNKARRIDTRLALSLSKMTRLKDGKPEKINLTFLDLLAGSRHGLTSGQEASARLEVPNPLTDEEMAGEPDGDILRNQGLDKQTPLWYYILKEAVLRGGGERLGPVGSRIVAETIYGILRWSQPYSILREHQSIPELGKVWRMVDLLHFGLGRDINPLG